MLGIHPLVMSHKLALFKEVQWVSHKKRGMGYKKRQVVEEEVGKLQEVGFMREVTYTMWLANVVMVKKSSGVVHVH